MPPVLSFAPLLCAALGGGTEPLAAAAAPGSETSPATEDASAGDAVLRTEPAAQGPGLPPAPWTLTYADGSGNRTRLEQAVAGASIAWTYEPVTPAQSSSGTYSGGAARQGRLDEDQAATLWAQAVGLTEGLAPAEGGRALGTGGLTVASPLGGPVRWVLARSASLDAFEAALLALPTGSSGAD